MLIFYHRYFVSVKQTALNWNFVNITTQATNKSCRSYVLDFNEALNVVKPIMAKHIRNIKDRALKRSSQYKYKYRSLTLS